MSTIGSTVNRFVVPPLLTSLSSSSSIMSRVKSQPFTADSPQLTLEQRWDGLKFVDVVETKATLRFTAQELYALGTVLDPESILQTAPHLRWIGNPSSSPDMANEADRRRVQIEWECRWKMLTTGLFSLCVGEFVPPVPIPATIERIAYIHDTGTLYGYFRRKPLGAFEASATALHPSGESGSNGTAATAGHALLNGKASAPSVLSSVERAVADLRTRMTLARLSKSLDLQYEGTGTIVNACNPSPFVFRFEGAVPWDMIDYSIVDPTTKAVIILPSYDHCVHRFMVPSTMMDTLAPSFSGYRQLLERVLGVPVIQKWTSAAGLKWEDWMEEQRWKASQPQPATSTLT